MKKVWYLDAQYEADFPHKKEVDDLWSICELGNDHYMWKGSVTDLLEFNGYPVQRWDPEKVKWTDSTADFTALAEYLRAIVGSDTEEIIIRYWW